jgi:hypothetical protein
MIPNRIEAIELLKENLKEKANLEHCFLVGYGMQGLFQTSWRKLRLLVCCWPLA